MSNDASLAGTLDGNCGHQSLFSSTRLLHLFANNLQGGFVVGIFIISTKRVRVILNEISRVPCCYLLPVIRAN